MTATEKGQESTARGLILRRIDDSGGWIPFDEFMRLALHEPGLGYYARPNVPLGAGGDFVTAPEISGLYSSALARFVAAALPGGGSLLEVGGGSGKLMRALLQQLAVTGLEPDCLALETNPALARIQGDELAASGLAGRCSWVDAVPEGFRGVVILNEVLDALPCRVFARRRGKWVERGVGASGEGKLTWSDGPVADEACVGRLDGLGLPDGYQAEVNLQAEALVSTLAEALGDGVMLIVDYGFPRGEMYHPQRIGGTLMSHRRHMADADVLSNPGCQDITSHVDFTAMADAAASAGCRVSGFTTQSSFLLDLGITDLAEDIGEEAERLAASRELQALLMPQEMGELFKVMACARGNAGPLPGFSLSEKSHAL